MEGPVNDAWYTGCSVTDVNKLTAWWGLKLPNLAYVTNIEIYYYRGGKYQYFLKFKLPFID